MATFQDYLNELTKTNRHPIMKIEILRQDETPLSDITMDLKLEGGLNVSNENGSRRSLSLALDNIMKQYLPDINSNFWIGTKVKLYLGLLINDEEYLIPSGVFVMDDPSVSSNGTTQLNMIDKFSLMNGEIGGILDSILIINAGTTVYNALKTMMTLVNDPNDIIIDSTVALETLPYQIIKEEGGTIGDIVLEIADAFSCRVYYDANGFLVFEKDSNDATKGATWNFTVGENEVNYQGGNLTWRFSDVINSVLVIGDNINGAIARGVAKNNDLLSNTSIPNIGIEKLLVVNDDIIYNNTLAEERAKYELKLATVALTETSISSIPIYHLDVDKVVKVTDDYLGLDGKRLLINSYSIPFNNSSMSLGLIDTFEIDL